MPQSMIKMKIVFFIRQEYMYFDDYLLCPITTNFTLQGYRGLDILADDVASAISLFSAENQFISFDAGFNAEEEEMFASLKVDDRDFHQRFSLSRKGIANFTSNFADDLMKLGNNIQVAAKAGASITRFIGSLFNNIDYDKMLVMYGSRVNTDFWHIDHGCGEYRILMTLKGDGTLFCKLAEDEKIRLQKTKNLHPHGKKCFLGNFSRIQDDCDAAQGNEIFQAQPLQPTVIKTRCMGGPTLHASPIVKSARFFISFWPM
jgi:hypothetical protein